MIYINLLIIGFLCVFVVDYSGFIDEMESLISRWLKSPIKYRIPKPFSCSLCLIWWIGLIYLLIVGQFTFPYVALVAGISALSPEILMVIYFIKGFISRIISSIEYYLGIE